MSRRRASCFQAAVAIAALTGCGGSERDAPVPPPIAASKPAKPTEPAPATTAPAAESAPVASAPAEAPPAPSTTGTPAPIPAPASTPGTSLPGAIPPAPAPDPNAKPKEPPVDPLVWMRDSQARKADYQRRLDAADADVVNANAKVAEWEKNVLAFSNPFLARPQLSPEDASAIAGMDGAQRVNWAKQRLADARASRDASQKALDDLKANPPLN